MRTCPRTKDSCPGRFAPAGRWLNGAAFRAIAFGVILCAVFFGCADQSEYYAVGTPAQKKELKELVRLLALEKKPDEKRFVVMRQIADELLSMGQYEKLCNFLTTYVEKNRDDAYDAYYLLLVANVYDLQGASPFAEYYYERIVNNYRDLLIEGASIHEACLNELIKLVQDPEQKVRYYRQVISRFPKSTDMGYAYFMLGKTYEQLGEWELAIKAYTDFRPFFDTTIPDFPDASAYAKGLVDFFNSSKDWTFENLSDLVTAVKTAMENGNASRLSRLRAKVNFFAMSWEQDEEDMNSLVEFSFAPFMDSGRIFFEDSLDKDSNSREAFLKTWGWTLRISPWYLYFRKINFPADPEIHGRWEWAGIYFGEKH
jgi:hypothetical protein